MTLLPNTRIPVPPPEGYRWHLTPSVFEGAVLELHLDEDPDSTGEWLTKREKKAIRRLMAAEPPVTHVGTPIRKERHIRKVSKRIVAEHFEAIHREKMVLALASLARTQSQSGPRIMISSSGPTPRATGHASR